MSLAHAAQTVLASTRDAIGLTTSAVLNLFAEGNILIAPRRLARMLLDLVLAAWLLIAPAIADVQYLTSGNRTRSYWVHPPDDPTPGVKYPVVLAFHGASHLGYDADGFAMQLDVRMSLPAVRTRYSADRYFIYPNGIGGVWAGPSYGQVSVDEDLQFVTDMLDDVESRYDNIDEKRIYAVGMSNGGGFVGTMACDADLVGGRVAAFAAVAGSFYTDVTTADHNNGGSNDDCTPARSPLPMLEIHGGSDKGVYYDGGMGRGGPLPSIPEWLDGWAARNKCTSNTTTHSDGGNVHHTSWTCDGQNGVLQHWKVDANGHSWPSRSRNVNMMVAGMGPQPIEANDLVIGLFDQFSLLD